MNSLVLPEIYIINILGIMLMLGNYWGRSINIKKSQEDKYMIWITLSVTISCIVDSLVSFCSGKAGFFYCIIIYLGNTWLYFSIMLIGPLWVLLIESHNKTTKVKLLHSLINYISLLGVIGLFINLFKPLIFYIDSSNIYHRGQYFYLYVLFSVFFYFCGITVYINKRNRISMIPFVPTFQIFFPIVISMLFEIFFKGISMIWGGCAVSISLMTIAFQNENICRDKLTGLFNRYYLDHIDLKYEDRGILCFMMIDINGFKQINDKYGHSEGDKGLMFVSECVSNSVGDNGSVIRYAGDEFVVLLNTKEYKEAENCIKRINENLEQVNKELQKDYSLSLSIGYEIFDMRVIRMEEILEVIDKKMYEEKKKYYSTHDRRVHTEENIQ